MKGWLVPDRMLREVVEDVRSLGSLLFYVLLMLFFVFRGDWFIVRGLLVAFFVIELVGGCIKLFWFSPRPDNQKFRSWVGRIDASSFPSVHTARAVFLALFFARLLDSVVFSVFFGVLAACVGWSRIALHRHRLVDVLAGVVLGVLVGLFVWLL